MTQQTLFDPEEMDNLQGTTKEKPPVLDEIRAMQEKKFGPDWWKNETLPKKRSKKRRKKR